jgi:cytoskeletal protein CcmA (bactofilin family)
MSYLLNKTDGTLLINLVDGTADGPDINPGQNISDLDLFGKNYPVYGQWLDENFIRLLQNFANVTAPTKPLQGELWYDTSTGFLKIYTGTIWKLVSPVLISSTAPTSNTFGSVVGTQWWDSVNLQLNTWNGNSWTLIGPAYKATDGVSGAIVEDILDTLGGSHTVIKFYHNNKVVAISNYDSVFTISPVNPVTGFSTIAPGLTLATGIANEIQFIGSATNAKMLGNVVATNYARTDIVPTFSSNILISNGNISIDSVPSTGAARYYNAVVGGNISLWPNVGGIATRAFSVSGLNGSTNVLGNLNIQNGNSISIYGTTSTGATGTGQLVFNTNPGFSGVVFAANVSSGIIQNTSLTAGRVVYSTTGGTETDSANLTFDGSTLTTNNLGVSNNTSINGTLAVSGNVTLGNLNIQNGNSISIYGTTSTGATGTGQLVFSASPTFTGTVSAGTVSASILKNTSLTAGRVVYSTTGGAETDSANLTFDGSTLTTNNLGVSNNTSINGTLAVSGHVTLEGQTSTGATGTGQLVFSAGPTITGTLTASAIAFNGTLTATQNINVNSGKVIINATTGDITALGNLLATHLTVEGRTTVGVTGTSGVLVFDTSPTLVGTPLTPTASASTSTTQIASTAFVQNAIAASTGALWLGSSKTVSTGLPNNSQGNNGDFWFQI